MGFFKKIIEPKVRNISYQKHSIYYTIKMTNIIINSLRSNLVMHHI
jgi:hypothetical protein